MIKIVLATDGQRLIKVECPRIASGDKNADYLRVNCCPTWDGFAKTAIFYRNENAVYYGVLDDNNECVIPWEVMQSEGFIYLGMYGLKGEIRQTTEVISYKIEKGAFIDQTKPSDPTPDVYEQIVNRIESVARVAEGADDKIDDHVDNKSNPHGVTKSQVGLGNVPNVTTDNQTPTYTVASTLANLVSGEKLSVAFGKIAKAVADFISHIGNKSNPHGVSISQIGAAPVSHTEDKNNPHGVTKDQIGLGSVTNTSDADKPVSTAQATAIAEAKKAGTDAQTNLNIHTSNKSNPHGVTADQVGARANNWLPTPEEIGAAPSGYGLGEDVGRYCANCNTTKKPGFYYVNSNTSNAPTGVVGPLLVQSIVATNGIDTYQTITNGASVVRRYYSSYAGAWQPWEWVNPPMITGTEYRTTKRANDAVVYTKRFSFGDLPNATARRVKIPDFTSSYTAVNTIFTIKNKTNCSSMNLAYGADPGYFMEQASASVVNLVVNTSGDFSGYTGVVTIEYTK